MRHGFGSLFGKIKFSDFLRKWRCVAAMFVVAVVCVCGAWGYTYTWTGGGGSDTNWTTSGNWSGGMGMSYPGSGDTATFTKAAKVTLDSDITIATLTVTGGSETAGALKFTGVKTLTVSGVSDNVINVGTAITSIELAINMTVTGQLLFHSKTNLTVDNGYTLTTNGNFRYNGETATTNTSSITVNGNLNCVYFSSNNYPNLTLMVGSAGVITATGNVVFNSPVIINNGGVLQSSAAVTLSGTLSNAGTLSVTGSGTMALSGTVTNKGTISCETGSATLSGAVTNSGTISTTSGTITNSYSSAQNIDGTVSITSAGGTVKNSSSSALNLTKLVLSANGILNAAFGDITVTSLTNSTPRDLTVLGSTVTLPSNGAAAALIVGDGSAATKAILSGDFSATSVTVNAKATFSATSGTLTCTGAYSNSGTSLIYNLTLSGNLTNTDAFSATGTTTLSATADTTITGKSTASDTTFASLTKSVTSAAALTINNAITVSGDLVLNGASGALLSVAGTASDSITISSSQAKGQYLNVTASTGPRILSSGSDSYVYTAYNSSTATTAVTNGWNIIDGALAFVWNGSSGTSWGTAANWNTGIVPGVDSFTGFDVEIPAVTNYPVVDAAYSIKALTIGASGVTAPTITLSDKVLKASGTLSNYGTIIYTGAARITDGTNAKNDILHYGTVEYAGTSGGTITDFGTTDYYNLIVSSGTWTASGAIAATGAVTVSGGTAAFNDALTVTGALTVSGGDVSFNNGSGGTAVSAATASFAATATGAVSLGNGSTDSFTLGTGSSLTLPSTLGSLTLAGTITASAGITLSKDATLAAATTFASAVSLGSNVTLDGAYLVTTSGTLGSSVSGTGRTLTLKNASLTNTGVVTDMSLVFTENAATAQAFIPNSSSTYTAVTVNKTPSGTFAVNTNALKVTTLTLTQAGGMTFDTSVTATKISDAAGAGAITFNGGATVTDAANFLTTGTLTLGDASTDSFTFTGGVTHTAGITAIAGNISTTNNAVTFGSDSKNILIKSSSSIKNVTGAINLNGTTNFTDDYTLTLGDGINSASITVNAVIAAAGSTGTIAVQNVGGEVNFAGNIGASDSYLKSISLTKSGGTVTFVDGKEVYVTNLLTSSGAYAVTANSTLFNVTNAVSFLNTGTLTLGNNNTDRLTFSNGVTANAPSLKSIAGTITASGSDINFGSSDTTVSATATLDGSTTGAITLAAVNVAYGVTLNIGATGDTNAIAVGTVTPAVNASGAIIVKNSGTVTFKENIGTSSFYLGNLSLVMGGGTVTFVDLKNVYVTNLLTSSGAYAVIANSHLFNVTNAVTFSNTGVLTLGNNNTDSFTFTNGVTATAPSSKSIAGTITASSGDINFGTSATTATTEVTLKASASSGNVTTAKLSSLSGNIVISAGTAVSCTGDVSTTSGNITVTAGTAATFSGAVSASGAITVTSTSGSITASGTVTATSGDINLTASSGTITTGGDISTTSGNITLTGNVVLPKSTTSDTTVTNVKYSVTGSTDTITVTGKIDGTIYNTQGLEIATDAGAISLGGAIGSSVPLHHIYFTTNQTTEFTVPSISGVFLALGITTHGKITQSGALSGNYLYVKTLKYIDVSTDIILNNSDNDFVGVILATLDSSAASPVASAISYTDKNEFAIVSDSTFISTALGGICSSGVITLTAGGALTQSGPITGEGSLLLLGTGSCTLENTSNNIASLAANLTGTTNKVSYIDKDAFEVAAVGTTPTAGISATGSVTLVATAGALTVSQPVSSSGGAIAFTSSGNTILNYAAANVVSNTAAAAASGTVTFNSAVSLKANASVASTKGKITFVKTIDAVTSGSQTLTVDSNTAAVEFDDVIGGTIPLGAIVVSGDYGITVKRNITTNAADITFNDGVILNNMSGITISTGTGIGNISFISTIKGTAANSDSLTLAAGTGRVTFSGAVGSGTAIGALSVTATGGAIVKADISAANVAFKTDTPVTLAGSGIEIITNGGEVSFASTLDSDSSTTLRDLTINSGTGTVTFTGAVGGTAGATALNALVIKCGKCTVNKTLYAASMSVKNSGLFLTVEDADITLTGGSFTQVSTSTGLNQLAGGIITSGNQTIKFATDVYLYGSTGSMALGGGSGAITMSANLHVAASAVDKIININSPLTAVNAILYGGTLSLSGTNSALATTDDLILLGSAYSIDDTATGASGVTGLFAYNHTSRSTYGKASTYTDDFKTTCPDVTSISTSYVGAVSVASDKKITVGQNFYANGITITGAVTWYLDIPDNGNATVAFAEAYNTTVSNCTVQNTTSGGTCAYVSAAENCTATSCTGWDTERPTISEAYTVYDDVIYIKFSEKLENSHGEINTAFASEKITYTNGTASYYRAYSNADCTDLISSTNNDIQEFYIRAQSTSTGTWNTDATGVSLGAEESMDRGRTGVTATHKTAIPSIDIPKALSALYETLRDEHKNRITHYYGDTYRCTDISDHCAPVLVAVYTGQELHTDYTSSADSQPPYDAHNFIEFKYSEAVDIGNMTSDTAAAPTLTGWSTEKGWVNEKAETSFSSSSKHGGSIETNGTGLKVTGYATIENGALTAGNKTTGSTDTTVSSLYRTFATTAGGTAANQTHRIRVSVAGYVDGTVPVNLNPHNNWIGYITSAATPSGTVTRVENSYITDTSTAVTGGNILDASSTSSNHALPTISVNTTDSELYGSWDVSKPTFAPYMINGDKTKNPVWENGGNINGSTQYEIIGTVASSANSYLDRIEFHLFDNTPEYSSSDTYKWFAKNGWKNTSGTVVQSAQDVSGGAKESFDNNKITGGIRCSSLVGVNNSFSYSFDGGSSYKNFSEDPILQSVKSSLFFASENPTTAPNSDSLYFAIFLNSSDRDLPLRTVFKVKYNNSSSYITDLAGNRLESKDNLNTIDRTVPQFSILVSPVGQDQIYVVFSKKLDLSGNNLSVIPGQLELIETISGATSDTPTLSDIQIDSTVAATEMFSNNNGTGLIFTIKSVSGRTITLEDVKNLWVRVKKPSSTTTDPLTGSEAYVTEIKDAIGNYMTYYSCHAISDFAVNVVTPVYAYDISDSTFDSYDSQTSLHTIRNFTGTGTNDNRLLTNKDIMMELKITGGTNSSGEEIATTDKPIIFFDRTIDSGSAADLYNSQTGADLRIWLPTELKSLATNANVPENTTGLAQDSANKTDSSLRYFIIPDADEDNSFNWKSNDKVQFVIKLLDSNGNAITIDHDGDISTANVPLYAFRLSDSSDITSVDLWQFNMVSKKLQRGGVTILNNVINPTNSDETVVQVDADAGNLIVTVMTLDGNIVKYLEHGTVEAGTHYYRWNGTNNAGNAVARGLYFVRVVGEGIDETRKVMVVK